MLWSVRHTTHYDYSAPVFLEPQELRLTPCTDVTQRLMAYEMQIEPGPAGLSENLDFDGNNVTRTWFEGQTESLNIEVTATVETLREDPFLYLWEGSRSMPLRYRDDLRLPTWAYSDGRMLGEVGALADEAAVQAGGNAQEFPLALADAIKGRCRQVYREEGRPRQGIETLRLGEGSCRDMVQLFLEASRGKGFAGRFVSGYLANDQETRHELHAWAELYMPGGGWRGFDPTTGLAAGPHYIALARGADALQAAPLTGSIRGSASARLSASVSIELLKPASKG